MVARDSAPRSVTDRARIAAPRTCSGCASHRLALWTLGVPLALVVLLLLALLVLGALQVPIAGTALRAQLERAAAKPLGRAVKLEGPLVFVPGLEPKLAIGGLRILNPAGFTTPDFATLGDASVQLALLPLLRGRLHILALEARNAHIRLETAADGARNWRFAPQDAASPTAAEPSESSTTSDEVMPLAVEVERLALADIVVEYHDTRSATTRRFDLDSLIGEGAGTRPLTVQFRGRIEREFPYTGRIQGGPLVQLGSGPWPFEIDLALVGSSVHVDGMFDAAAGRTQATLGLGAENLAEIERFLQTKLPPVGATGFAAQVEWHHRTLRLEAIRAVMGASSLDGRLELALGGERPRLSGRLAVPQLDVRPFLGVTAGPEAPDQPVRYAELEQVTLDLRRLADLDVDVDLRIGRVPGLPGDVHDASIDVDLRGGVLDAPLAATLADVAVAGRLAANVGADVPSVALELGARDTGLGRLAEVLAGLRGLQGRLGRFDLRIAGHGETVGDWVRALEAKIAAGDARVTYGNEPGARPVEVVLAELAVALPAGKALRGEARGALLGVPVAMSLAGGDFATLLREQRTPLDLRLRGAGATLAIKGDLAQPTADRGSDLRFAVEAKRAGDLAAWLGVSPRAAAPIAIVGRARMQSDEWHLEDAKARLGRSQVAVDAHRTGVGTRTPFTIVSVRSPLIDVPELESLLPPPQRRRDESPAVIDIPVLPRGIDLADADIGVGLERVVLGRADLVNAGFLARVREGRLPATPIAATLADVPFQGTLALDLRSAVPELALALGTDNVDVGALLARLEVAEGLDTRVDALRLEIRGRGERLGEMLRRSSFRAVLDGGKLILRDPTRKVLAEIALAQAVAGAEAGEAVRVNIDGRIDRTPLRIAIESGTLTAFFEPQKFVPFRADADAAGAHLDVHGKAALPLRVGEGDLTLVLSGARLDSLSDLARMALPPWGPWSLSGPLRVTRDAYEVPFLELRVGKSVLQGKGRVAVAGKRPRVDVAVKAPLVQLDDFPLEQWSAFRGADAAGATLADARAKAKRAAAQSEALLSRETLARFDAYVDVQVDEVRSGADRLGNGWLRAQADDGRVTVGPAQVNLPGGTATLALGYTPTEQGVEVALGAYVDRFDYGVLARRAQAGTEAEGELSLRMDLASRAPTLDAVMAHANGRIDFAVWPKRIAADVFDLWAVNVFVALLPAVDGAEGSRVNCAVGRFDLKDGKLTEDRLLLDTSRMRVDGRGQVDFATERLEFRMQPRAKRAQLFSLQTPVDVRGTLEDFKVGVRGEDVLATVVRFFGSVLVVPLERLMQGPVPEDGRDVCMDPLRETQAAAR